MEKRISFLSGAIHIEGLLNKSEGPRGVVIAHPHPLYGGNMNDFVVESIGNAFLGHGYSTLKFNFRGVGKSRGQFDNGIGEQSDLTAAIRYLFDSGIQTIDLAGYSFGTWVISRIDPDVFGPDVWGIENVVFVSPPVGLMDFDGDLSVKRLTLAVTGSLDGFSPPDLIRKKLNQWRSKASLEIIAGSDHFYGGYHVTLESIISSHLDSIIGSP
jgi:uncharacterized protein